ncbi:MAG: hypothetical protein LBG16_03345 [Elusimicrobiota bacterium]|jgi:hypothetical protein|nr:hypothetical protein [Elusimicrobiota bacterium]
MKNILLLVFASALLAGCYNNSAGAVKERSFAQQYAELEKEPPQAPAAGVGGDITLQTAADREAQVSADAQKERRAQPPLVESNYIFKIMPDKNVYSYDEYNQVWSDAPKEKDYKSTKRLWTKPKRYQGDYEPEADTPEASPETLSPPDDGDWVE